EAGVRDLRAGGRVVEGKERRRDGQNGDSAVPPAGERARARLGLVLLDELLGLVVGEHCLEVGTRDDLGRRRAHRVPSRVARSQGRSSARTRTTVSPNVPFSASVQWLVAKRCSPAGVTRMTSSGSGLTLVGASSIQRPSSPRAGSPFQPTYSIEWRSPAARA